MITRYYFGFSLFVIIPALQVNGDDILGNISKNKYGRKFSKNPNEFSRSDRTLFPSSYYDSDSRTKWERVEQTGLDRQTDGRLAGKHEQRTMFGGTEVVGGSYMDSMQDQIDGLAEARPEDVVEVADAMKPFFQKHMTKMLIAYKIKFFLLIPVLVGGLMLIVGSSSLAGLFFAMFVIGLWSRQG